MEPAVFNKPPTRESLPLSKTLWLLLLIVGIDLIGRTFYQAYIKGSLTPLSFISILRLIETICLLMMVFLWGYQLRHLGIAKNRLKTGLFHGLLWCLGFGVMVGILSLFLLIFGINPLYIFGRARFGRPWDLFAYIMIGCLWGPMVEDLVFIGLLYNGLRTRLNIIISSLIVATFFALAHEFISLYLMIQFVGGLLFTLSFEFSGSLITPIIIHSCGNLAILMIQLL